MPADDDVTPLLAALEARVAALEAARRPPGAAAAGTAGALGARPVRRQGLPEVIGRALTDQRFRQELLDDASGVAERLALTPAERDALVRLPRQVLEEHARRFGAGSAAGTTVSVAVRGEF